MHDPQHHSYVFRCVGLGSLPNYVHGACSLGQCWSSWLWWARPLWRSLLWVGPAAQRGDPEATVRMPIVSLAVSGTQVPVRGSLAG